MNEEDKIIQWYLPSNLTDEGLSEMVTIKSSHSSVGRSTAVTVPADKLAELQRKAYLVDQLVAMLEVIINRWDSPLWNDVPTTARYINAARSIVHKAKGE